MQCIYCGEKTGLVAEVQHDDPHMVGKEKDLIQFKQNLSKGVSLMRPSIIMQGMQYSHLEREGMVLRDGTCDLGDTKPSLGIFCREDCNSSHVPVTTTRSAGEQASADCLNEVETSIYCRCGLLCYLRSACGDLNVVAKELPHGLAKPTTSDTPRLKEMARYLKSTMGLPTWLPKSDGIWKISAFSDSDWTNDKIARKKRGRRRHKGRRQRCDGLHTAEARRRQ